MPPYGGVVRLCPAMDDLQHRNPRPERLHQRLSLESKPSMPNSEMPRYLARPIALVPSFVRSKLGV